MKTMIAAALLVFSANSFARTLPAYECSNGKIGEDSYIRISTMSGDLEFQMHESFITARATVTKSSGNTISVLNRNLKGNAQGDQFTARTNALLVYNPTGNTMNVTLVLDGNAQIRAVDLNCN